MNIDRIVLTTFAGYYFSQILCLRSIQQYAAGFPIDIIVDDFDIQHWPTYPEDCEQYITNNFPDLDITFHRFSDFAGMEQVRTGGWFRQQLVKLYLDRFVSGNRWLLVDADVVFLESPRVDMLSATMGNGGPIDLGNRLYVQHMLHTEQPWVVDKDEYWCMSAVPFRLIERDLLIELRQHAELLHGNFFKHHLDLFQTEQLVAFDPNGQTMIMSEFQLIEVFRNRYYKHPLPIGVCVASHFEHSSVKDWQFDRTWFEQQRINVTDQAWEHSQNFGKHHV